MSCFVQYTPYRLRESDWDGERENLGNVVQATLERFFPGFGDLVLHREVVTPLDIERVTGLTEGNIFAGELLAPQMFFFRPARVGPSTGRRSRATTSAARAPTPGGVSWAPPGGWPPQRSPGPDRGSLDADGPASHLWFGGAGQFRGLRPRRVDPSSVARAERARAETVEDDR